MAHLDQQTSKRTNYISWDDYFMSVAVLASMRSKDPSTQVGSCIVDENNVILSSGYNGLPIGCSDDDFTWSREGEDNKYLYAVHSEPNAILNAGGKSLKNATIYITAFPCNNCAKLIIQSGIKHVIYLHDKFDPYMHNAASLKMFSASGVSIVKYKSNVKELLINLNN